MAEEKKKPEEEEQKKSESPEAEKPEEKRKSRRRAATLRKKLPMTSRRTKMVKEQNQNPRRNLNRRKSLRPMFRSCRKMISSKLRISL